MAITYHAGRRIQGTSTSTDEYKVHSFTSGGTFAVTGSGNVEYLVIAGAGGGGGGGGGAGGYRTNVSGETSGGGASAEATYGVTAQNYTITVGSGGSGSNAQSGARGGSGGNSSIVPASGTSIISLGGAGGGVGPQAPITGGSGGGGSYDSGTQAGSAGTSGQGFAGGSNGGFTSSPTPAGGGGGSSSVGANAVNSTTSGAGGAGTSSSIIGSAVIRAGGGGGGNTRNTGTAGAGGSGGGTAGVLQGSSGSTSASANTGSGSGGGGDQNNGSGGSGIVIVRYANDGSITATGGTVTTIDVTSTVVKPSNVQLGSRFEETDTRKIYHYDAQVPNLDYTSFPSDYTGWTKSSNDATKVAFSSNRANLSIGEAYVDARAYGYDIGFDLDGDYCIDFDFTFTNTPFTSSGQAVGFTFGISTTTADVGGEDPTMNSEQTKISGYTSGSYTYIYARAKSSAGTNASGEQNNNTAFPLNSSSTQLRYGRLSRSGTTFRVQFFSDSTRQTEVANYSVTTTAQTVRYLYLKSYSQNSGQAWASYLDNIKIYKDSIVPLTGNIWSEEGT